MPVSLEILLRKFLMRVEVGYACNLPAYSVCPLWVHVFLLALFRLLTPCSLGASQFVILLLEHAAMPDKTTSEKDSRRAELQLIVVTVVGATIRVYIIWNST